MASFLKKYNIELKTVGPVFIGSGKIINKKEAIFIEDSVIIIDTQKMFKYLSDNRLLDKYQDYMLDDRMDLATFLQNNNIDKDVYSKWDSKELSLEDARSTSQGDAKSEGISSFVRDGNGKVYVPGSSLKGMLRTILIGACIISDKNKHKYVCNILDDGLERFKLAENEIKNKSEERWFKSKAKKQEWVEKEKIKKIRGIFKKQVDDIEVQLFHKKLFSDPYGKNKLENKINDILRGFMVSDSEYISDEDMCVCQKIDIGLDKEERTIPLYRECIKPGVSIKFSITIDSTCCDYNKKSIKESIGLFYNDNYWEKILKQFKNVAPVIDGRYTCFLGGGTGFESKTVIYPSFERPKAVDFTSDILSVLFPDVNHDADREVSPRVVKCTYYKNNKYLFGACKLDKFSDPEEPIKV